MWMAMVKGRWTGRRCCEKGHAAICEAGRLPRGKLIPTDPSRPVNFGIYELTNFVGNRIQLNSL
jgi:hypothetical protein